MEPQLQEQLLQQSVNTVRIQYLAIAGSILFLLLILELIRRKKIREAYSLLWLFFGIVFLFFSIFRSCLEKLANLMGIAYAPAAILILLLMAIIFVLIQFSVILSQLSEQNKKLIQEVGTLKAEIESLKKNNESKSV
ncbi:MAG: DUF2304 domain-containing protein [Lentimicrobiaceae bacterium]|nr:DUF2304 domain-containing protein [Lentimicrobiaceae bacterium]